MRIILEKINIIAIWKKINIIAIISSIILIIINSINEIFLFGYEHHTLIQDLSSQAGELVFSTNIFIIAPIAFITLIVKRQLTWKIFLTNLGLMLVHITISLYFILMAL